MSVQETGDPTACAAHPTVKLVVDHDGHKTCPQCRPVPTCPRHPQCQVWRHIDGRGITTMRCAICGVELRTPGMVAAPDEPTFGHKPGAEPDVVRTFARYRELAARTDGNHDVPYYAGGLCEEAGECWNLVKRSVYQGEARDPARELEEIGDALWLLDRLAARLGVTLEEAATRNIAKLKEAYPDGYSPAAARARRRRA